MAREVVLDANVLVAQLDGADALAWQAGDLARRLRAEGATLVLLDFLLAEAVSVLSRRARERKTAPPDLGVILGVVRGWASSGTIRWTSNEIQGRWLEALVVMEESGGALNFNDAMLVVLQRAQVIADVASFDRGFDRVADFRRVS